MSFVLKNYLYDKQNKSAHFHYQNNSIDFEEIIEFHQVKDDHNQDALDRALFMAFVLIGTSYYKTFPSADIQILQGGIDDWQQTFFNSVYQEGLSQYAFENNLSRTGLAHFNTRDAINHSAVDYSATDQTPLVLQSGGKDSLLLSTLLAKKHVAYDPWFVQSAESHPGILDTLGNKLITVRRKLDTISLHSAEENGAKNGHVPVTYIVLSLALIQAILLGKDTVLMSVGHEGEEPHTQIGDLPVMHQWAKTWKSEQQFSQYVEKYVTSTIKIGSPLRKYSELKIAELFVKECWEKYSDSFSSCNIGNYKQGTDNTTLGWCGDCPKCANSYLLFAPFVSSSELSKVFNNENLFKKDSLQQVFKGLLGVDGVMKPLECVGEVDELRKAYHLAQENDVEYVLSFAVPASNFDYNQLYDVQEWAASLA